MDAEAKKLFAGDTWAISGDRREVEDQSIAYPIQRANGFQEDYSENANPDREIFNQILCEVVSACKETLHGISPWDKDVTYPADSYTQVNGALYHALEINTGVNPADTNQRTWALIGDRLALPSTAPSTIASTAVFIDNTRADRIKVYWNPPDDGGSAITAVRLRYSKTSDFSSGVTSIANYTQGTDIAITNRDSDLYYIRLRFTNAIGDSAESASFRVRASALLPPAITGFSTSTGGASGRVDLTWNAVNPSNGLTISKYRVEWKSGTEAFSSSASPSRHKETTSTSTNITGLTNGTAYTFRVIPVSNRSTENAGSATQSATPTAGSQVPSKATISLVGGLGNIIASATNVPSANGSPIREYEWQYRLSSDTEWTWATNTTAPLTTIGSLSAGDYVVRMRAVNSVGNGEWSDTGNATVTANSAPSNVVAIASSGGAGKVVVSVGSDTDDGGSSITGYQWAYKLSTNSTWTSLTSSTNPTQVISGLTGGSTYNFRVSATNAIGTTTSSSVNFVVVSQTNTPVARKIWMQSASTSPSDYYSKILIPFGYDANGTISRIDWRWVYGIYSGWVPDEDDWTDPLLSGRQTDAIWEKNLIFGGNFTQARIRYRIENENGWGAWSDDFYVSKDYNSARILT